MTCGCITAVFKVSTFTFLFSLSAHHLLLCMSAYKILLCLPLTGIHAFEFTVRSDRIHLYFKWSEVAQSCPTLCDPMDYSPPGFSVHGIFQAIVLEWVAISFSRRSSWPRDWTPVSLTVSRHFTTSQDHHLSSCLQSFPASGSFQMSHFFSSGGQSMGVSASASVLPKNIQDWSPLGWTGWISLQFKRLSRVFSNTSGWVLLISKITQTVRMLLVDP